VLVTGENGAGKTNLLESLHVATQGFSPRTRSDGELVRFGESAAAIELELRRTEVAHRVRMRLVDGGARVAELDGSRLPSAESLRREFPTLVFTPDRLAVIKAGPAARRAYFDRVLGRLQPARAGLPQEYASALAQRNAALRRVQLGLSERAVLAPWTERVAALGAALVEARGLVLAALAPVFAHRAAELGLEQALLAYEGDRPTTTLLESRLDADVVRGATGAGPHLHDVRISAGPRDLRSFGSQGEQRLAVLSLLLAEAEVIRERSGVPPLLLLDDVLSELDPGRRRVLAERISRDGQTLITSTSAAALPVEPTLLLEVSPGEVRAA